MTPGQRRELITVEKPVASPARNKLGEVDRTSSATWETHCQAWVSIAARGSREFKRRGITNDEVSASISLRYSATAAATLGTYRVKTRDGTIYSLQGPLVDPTGKRVELQGELIA